MKLSLPTLLLSCLMWLLTACHIDYDEHKADASPTDLKVESTLSNLRISSIIEDANGYVWMGTSRGLNRYSGDDMHQYFCNDTPNSLPDNRINALFCDSKGRIWVTTKNGVARYTDQDDFEPVNINYSNPRCQQIVENSHGDLFVSQTNVILKYNPQTNNFEKAIDDVSYIDPVMQMLFMDEEDNLWVVDDHSVTSYSTISFRQRERLYPHEGTEFHTSALIGRQLWLADGEGLSIYDVISHKWVDTPACVRTHPLYNNTRLLSITPLTDGKILFCSTDGLFVYDPVTQTNLFQSDPGFPFATTATNINLALCDSRGNLWLCSDSQGYSIIPAQSERFSNCTTLVNAMQGKTVISMSFDQHQTLWLATQGEGVYCYNICSDEIRKFDHRSVAYKKQQKLLNLNSRAYCIYADSQGYLWVGTTPRGLVQLRYKGGQLELVDYFNLPSIIVLTEDCEGSIWAGCYGNSYYSKRQSDSQFREHHLFSNTFSYLSCMEQLSNGRFVTLERGLGLRYINTSTMEQTQPIIPDSLLQRCIARSIFLPSALCEGQDGRLWIGTVSNGLMCYDPERQTLENIKGAPCEDIASIELDSEGNPWVSTQYGLGKYNIHSHSFTNFYHTDGLGGNEYFDRSSCRLPDGTLIFGGTHGITAFNPLEIPEEQTGKILLEDLKIHNTLVRPGQGKAIDRRLDLCEVINLEPEQNSFSISFSALDFNPEERYNYQYRLDCFNRNWVEAGSNREAFYANLKPGHYTFRVQLTNKEGDRVLAETSIPIILAPSLWGTWWMRWIISLVVLTIFTYIVRLYLSIRQEKRERLQSEREKQQEHRINQMNMNFFANVSHEFRTPLTVISGPISQLCQDPTIQGEAHRMLKVVNRSVLRMLQLVNQMMDFHKLEEDTLCLEVKRLDVVSFLRQVAEFFAVNAHDKNIDFHTQGLEDILVMWADLDKLDKILNNLLGNAMKYTPAGGRVVLSLDVVSGQEAQALFPKGQLTAGMQYVKIAITDNGKGIPEEAREKIFQRYYQLRNSTDNSFHWGTGIGLYYTKSLVTLHHGCIRAMENPDGQGSCFVFVLPMGQSAYSENEILSGEPSQSTLFPLQAEVSADLVQAAAPTEGADNQDARKPHLLVVDDDVEVIHYLKLLLAKNYRVTCRFDAVTALETLRQPDDEVDLVLSDVSMPGTTGLQLCQQIKDDPQLCHLPVILVTAKSTMQDQIDGINAGAMAYVTKPFDPAYLQALIQRLLGTRDQTRRALQENTSTQAPALEENALSAQDRAFMNELYRLMEEELSNPDMDVTRLTDLLHVSRSKLYYKIKGLTGENPSSFFKTYKLNRAAELIREGKYNLSEISLLTGFSTLSHFSTSFKRHFGVSPSEY